MDYQKRYKDSCQRLWQKSFPFLGRKIIKEKFHIHFGRSISLALYISIGKEKHMAKTKSSNHGKQQKKIVTVHGYTKGNGVKVKDHRRSTPN